MPFIINEGSAYESKSYIEYHSECMMCNEETTIQQLPAENNAGEYFGVQLCIKCLIKLALEILEDGV